MQTYVCTYIGAHDGCIVLELSYKIPIAIPILLVLMPNTTTVTFVLSFLYVGDICCVHLCHGEPRFSVCGESSHRSTNPLQGHQQHNPAGVHPVHGIGSHECILEVCKGNELHGEVSIYMYRQCYHVCTYVYTQMYSMLALLSCTCILYVDVRYACFVVVVTYIHIHIRT